MILDDMVGAVRRLIELGAASTPDSLGSERNEADMLQWNLVVLGEAAKRVPEATRQRFPGVPWQQASRTRDRIAHHYEGVNWRLVAEIVYEDLPDLLPQLTQIRNTLRDEAESA